MEPRFKLLSLVLPLVLAMSALAQEGSATRFDFESDKPGEPPQGFSFGRTGKGASGRWVVQAVDDGPSGKNVLVQTDADRTDYRFPIAYTGPAMKDLRLTVKCKPVSGKGDQGCGLIFRLKDDDNYYVARANALEDNVRLYHVVKGDRRQFAGWNGKVASGKWHDLAVEAQGDHFQVFFDGKKVIDAHDKTFTDAGKFGVWTKADSVIQFDDLTATPK
jgi:3-keto-disaccharide hydrolase